jgi:hypothetical protein
MQKLQKPQHVWFPAGYASLATKDQSRHQAMLLPIYAECPEQVYLEELMTQSHASAIDKCYILLTAG